MITVTASNRSTNKNMRTGALRNRAVRGISSLRRSQRSNLGLVDDSDFENPDNLDLGSQSSANEDDGPASFSVNRPRTRRIDSSSEDDVESIGSSSPASSSEYSDWIADQGASLEPPKRAKRKPVRASARARKAAGSVEDSPSDDETDDSDEPVLEPDSEEERKRKPKPKPKPKPKKKMPALPAALVSVPPGGELPDAFKPSEWLSQVVPKKSPYSPQMGDEVMFFKEGYQKYVEAVRAKKEYDIGPRCEPYEKYDLQEPQLTKVVGIKYEIRPPRLCCLKLCMLTPDGHMTRKFFTLKYHDMNDVIDFFVLNQTYQQAMQRNLQEGDNFRSMINDDWWTGVIESKVEKNSPFLSIKVQWDSQEMEYMSPWDLEPVDQNRIPDEVGGSVPVLPEEIEASLYQPSEEEWPNGGREESTQRILRGLEQVMGLSVAEDFLTPVDITQYPLYAFTIEYPIDLSLIKARFENNFYRRITAAQFDVRYLATNAEKFNEPHSPIVKNARIVTELCLKIISSPEDIDVSEEYHRILNGYHSSSGSEDVDMEDDPDKPGPSGIRSICRSSRSSKGPRKSVRQQALSIDPDDWRRQCIDLIELLWQQEDAEPFREPVNAEEYPDYPQIIKIPIDLSTVRNKLLDGDHENPHDFARDIRLIFTNSKNYNTNKHSRIYAMTCRLSSLFEDHMKSIIHDWKTAQIRSKTSLLKGKKGVSTLPMSGTDDSGGDNIRSTSCASSQLPGSLAGPSGLRLKQNRAFPNEDEVDDDEDEEDCRNVEHEEGDGQHSMEDDEGLDINAPGPSTRVSKSNGMSNGDSRRCVRSSKRTAHLLESDSGSECDDGQSLLRPVRSSVGKRKQYESDNSFDPALKTSKRRRTGAARNCVNANSRESFNDSDDSTSVPCKPKTRSVNGHSSYKGKGRVKFAARSRHQNGKKTLNPESNERSDSEDDMVNRRFVTKTRNNKIADDESESDSSCESSSEDDEEDSADSDESEQSVDLHAPPSKSNRATRSQSNSFEKGKRRTRIINHDDDDEEEDDDDDAGKEDEDGLSAGKVDYENSSGKSDTDDDKENEEDDDDAEGSFQSSARRSSRGRKNYNESDSENSDMSQNITKSQRTGNRPVRTGTRNRLPMQDYASSDDDNAPQKSSGRRKAYKPNYVEEESDEEPITTVSSRGRVRKVTEKARALLKH